MDIQKQVQKHVIKFDEVTNDETALKSWKIYLTTVATLEDIAIQWRIFTELASHATLLAVKRTIGLNQSLLDPCSKYQMELRRTICSRLENVSWRMWYDKSKKKSFGSYEKIEKSMELFPEIERNFDISDTFSLTRSISEPSIFSFSQNNNTRRHEFKIFEWIYNYERSVISRSNSFEGSEFDDQKYSDYPDDESDEMSELIDIIDLSTESFVQPIQSHSLLSKMLQQEHQQPRQSSLVHHCPCFIKHLVLKKRLPLEPLVQMVNVTINPRDNKKRKDWDDRELLSYCEGNTCLW